ncbi:tyrosine-type recombinase/integrase [Sphaerimonospora mesophila]|uniref:tyrosine-type recombinase/integrase n=1 Tax=Sphaerimonospora mesophila TaxID=37483 RepID=UPI0006E1ED6E
MTVTDRWHKSHPKKGEPVCSEHKRVPTREHGRGERWLVRYRDEKGLQLKRSFDRKADAEHFDAARRADTSRGDWIDPKLGQTKFGDYAPEWLAARLHKPTTAETYSNHLRKHVYPTFGTVPLASIRPTAVQQWVKGLRSKGLAPRTIETVYTIFASIMRGAVRDGLISKTPCRDIRLPHAAKTVIRLLTPVQVVTLSRAMPAEYGALVLLGAAAGLRQGEALGLSVDRLKFPEQMITIDRQVVIVDRRPILATPKSPASVREVPMPVFLGEALEKHIAEHAPADVLFRTARGNLMRRDYFNARIWKPAIKAAGLLPDTTFHDLRHTFASTALAEGVPISEVSRWLGHESITTTVDLYGHLVPEASERARTALDAAFCSALDVPPMCPDQE